MAYLLSLDSSNVSASSTGARRLSRPRGDERSVDQNVLSISRDTLSVHFCSKESIRHDKTLSLCYRIFEKGRVFEVSVCLVSFRKPGS